MIISKIFESANMLGHPFYWLMHFRFGILHIQRHVDLTSTLFNVHAFITLVCMHANPVTCHHIEMSRKFLWKCLISITIQPDIFWAQFLFFSCVLVNQICLMTNINLCSYFPHLFLIEFWTEKISVTFLCVISINIILQTV